MALTTEGARRVRVVFMGTPEFAVPTLRALASDPRCAVPLVVTQPDRPAGRGHALAPPPVKVAAAALGLPVYQPEALKSGDAVAVLAECQADLFVVAAFGQILREEVLQIPRLGCWNVHASLLPRWRGAAPVHRAIAAGDSVTGVAIMKMERGLDTGPVLAMHATMIGDTETAGELLERLATSGAALLAAHLDDIASGASEPTVQPRTRSTYASRLSSADRNVRWELPAALVAAHINGMSPSPGAAIRVGGEVLTLLRAQTSAASAAGAADHAPGAVVSADPSVGLRIAAGEGVVEVLEVKRPGKRPMAARECMRGFPLEVGSFVAPAS